MSSGQTPNSVNIERVGRGVAYETAIISHPEYIYWREEWRKIRDVLAGQKEVKRKGETYLPKMKGMEKEDYADYLTRATFYNMTAQTQTGMLGQVFRKDPYVEGLPKKFADDMRLRFSKDSLGHIAFAKTVMSEQIGMGRFGVLVDAPAAAMQEPTSFAVGYATENILDWRTEEVNGLYQLTRVLLREFTKNDVGRASQQNPWIGTDKDPNSPNYRMSPGQRGVGDGGNARAIATAATSRNKSAYVQTAGRYTDSYTYETQYRELVLEQQDDGSWVYSQYLYKDDPCGIPFNSATPIIRGKTLDFIPFKFFGAMSNSESVERSPMLDIADLNLSHYRTYAELEYGRLYTALPIYFAPGGQADGIAEYHIGPNKVWECPSGEKPGILEYTGSGLKTLETALSTKEDQIASIGGRMLPGLKSVSESNNQTILREANEQSVLLNCILAASDGMAEVVRWWLMFRDVALEQSVGLTYQINQEFLSTPVGAREIRAIQMLWIDGLITAEIFYHYLRRAEVIPAAVTFEDFETSLKDPGSWINNPDAQARQRGFASRQQELDQASTAREADLEQEALDIQWATLEQGQEVDSTTLDQGQQKIDLLKEQGDRGLSRQEDHGQQSLDIQKKQVDTTGKLGNKGIDVQNNLGQQKIKVDKMKAQAAIKQANKPAPKPNNPAPRAPAPRKPNGGK